MTLQIECTSHRGENEYFRADSDHKKPYYTTDTFYLTRLHHCVDVLMNRMNHHFLAEDGCNAFQKWTILYHMFWNMTSIVPIHSSYLEPETKCEGLFDLQGHNGRQCTIYGYYLALDFHILFRRPDVYFLIYNDFPLDTCRKLNITVKLEIRNEIKRNYMTNILGRTHA